MSADRGGHRPLGDRGWWLNRAPEEERGGLAFVDQPEFQDEDANSRWLTRTQNNRQQKLYCVGDA
jgi:hypothetical protein